MVRGMLLVDAHTVETALSAREAYHKFDSGDFDLVVADYLMPEMKGDQLAIVLKRHAKAPPIILISGDPPRIAPTEIDFILKKPFSLVDLRCAMDAVDHREAA
jgi:DNA-binding response OmpR family regulator